MAERAPRSIRYQLLGMAAGLLVVIALITYWAAYAYGDRAARLSYDRLLNGAALQMLEGVYARQGEVAVELSRAAFETLALAPEDRAFYAITDAFGEVITGYDDLPGAEAAAGRSKRMSALEPLEPHFYDAPYRGERVRFLTLSKLLTEGEINLEVQVQVGQTLRARQALAEEIRWRALQFVLVVLLVALALAVAGIWLVLRPLQQLNRGLETRSPRDLSPLDVAVPRELQPLLRTINRFMTQLGDTLAGLKRFTGEAAHQIRTPLAGLRSQAQNALEESDACRRKEQLRRVVESSDLLTDTVRQLLDQATLTHRFQSMAFEPVLLESVVTEVCREVAVAALHRGVEVAYLGVVSISLEGDAFALRQMLRNLLENAIKYSDAGGTVEVDLQSGDEGKGASLTISDSGPGIPDYEKAQVFERFYRSPDNPRPGSGLGLAIAREVAVHHKALLSLRDNQPRGLVVEVFFSQAEARLR